jgi:hypothetical protein
MRVALVMVGYLMAARSAFARSDGPRRRAAKIGIRFSQR